ncbi:hypothetical protein [Bacillus cereus]|uniref:hypothetical protein n=1 Tax=Bacillus cereus TaxID=1396 RepID=UPI0020D28212|nr:hypothetical protein [Bacillus cereus]
MFKWIQVLSAFSFVVYLMHNLVVVYIGNKLNLWPAQSIVMLLAAFIIITVITMIAIIIFASMKITCYPLTGMSFSEASRTCNIQFLWKTWTQSKGSKNDNAPL